MKKELFDNFEETGNLKVLFRIAPRDWRSGEICLKDIDRVLWDKVSGGSHPKRTHGYCLYAYADFQLVHDLLDKPYEHLYHNHMKIYILRARKDDPEHYPGYCLLKKWADKKY